jgi:hypothetical protein
MIEEDLISSDADCFLEGDAPFSSVSGRGTKHFEIWGGTPFFML